MSGNLSSAGRGNDRLAARRSKRRRRILVASFILLLLLLTAAVYGLNQSAVRIATVTVYGADQSFADIATAAMQGKYLGLIPRDSVFFFPASRIRADIITLHPDTAAISIFRNGFTSLSIKVNDRAPIARWCGERFDLNVTSSRSNLNGNCYVFDASGFIYATTSDARLVNAFVVYESLVNEHDPIGATLPNSMKLPAAFDFARELGTLGSPVTAVAIRGDEVDEYLKSGTRVTYVLGNEENAYTALVSGRANFNLVDGSIDYVDLRFDGKVYVKKKE